jgi:hypothetical protein
MEGLKTKKMTKVLIAQNNELRKCTIELGQKVKHPEGFWGNICMFGDDGNGEQRILMNNAEFEISRKRAAYPYELELTNEDFAKGELVKRF